MARPVLYLDIVGTLLLDKGGRLVLASYAKVFVEKLKDRASLRFLTSLQEHQARAVSRGLDADITFVPYPHALGKAAAIDFSEDFYWVDDDPSPADLLRLSDERASERLIPINRREGVNEGTLRKLLGLMASRESVTQAG